PAFGICYDSSRRSRPFRRTRSGGPCTVAACMRRPSRCRETESPERGRTSRTNWSPSTRMSGSENGTKASPSTSRWRAFQSPRSSGSTEAGGSMSPFGTFRVPWGCSAWDSLSWGRLSSIAGSEREPASSLPKDNRQDVRILQAVVEPDFLPGELGGRSPHIRISEALAPIAVDRVAQHPHVGAGLHDERVREIRLLPLRLEEDAHEPQRLVDLVLEARQSNAPLGGNRDELPTWQLRLERLHVLG